MRSPLAAIALLLILRGAAQGQDSVAPPPPAPVVPVAPSEVVVPLPSTTPIRPLLSVPGGPKAVPVPSNADIDRLPKLDSVQAWYYPKGKLTKRVSIVFQAIIDSTGRVVPESIQLVSMSDPAFAAAARLTLMAAYYHPATAHGRPVPIFIQQGLLYDGHTGHRCEIDAINYMVPPRC